MIYFLIMGENSIDLLSTSLPFSTGLPRLLGFAAWMPGKSSNKSSQMVVKKGDLPLEKVNKSTSLRISNGRVGLNLHFFFFSLNP